MVTDYMKLFIEQRYVNWNINYYFIFDLTYWDYNIIIYEKVGGLTFSLYYNIKDDVFKSRWLNTEYEIFKRKAIIEDLRKTLWI